MRRPNYFPFLLLAFFMLFMMSISKNKVDKFRNMAISSFIPTNNSSKFLLKIPDRTLSQNDNKIEMDKLLLENTMLKNQINGIYEWLFFENRIEDQVDKFKVLNEEDQKDIYLKDFFQRRAEELKEILKVEYQALSAKVIFRSASSWSSSIWINIGEKNNEALSKLIVAKNSPVVIGNNLIGIVEYVGEKFSRVRLITDSGFIPSVRAVRGKVQDKNLLNIISSLKNHVHARDNLFYSKDEKENFLDKLISLNSRLTNQKEDKYLAKGELHGTSQPLWRSKGTKLKGIGFNYDYADEEGPARDLKSGKIILDPESKSVLLIEKGDLLVTTGMDGIFPKGLNVGIVTKVYNLEDGDYAYNIEVKSTCANLNELEVVLVLPPLGFEMDEQNPF
ncbi:MAG TPA: rod shape-determining protein MreC [Chlamydiae bacterium]|nr:rod shape-determining protein MreC [Chlamydiota bacterium]